MKKNKSLHPVITEEKNIIDDHLLDIIGNEFKFDHQKGLSEWLKNSVDAYIRKDVSDKSQHVFFRFNDEDSENITFGCIDFIGMKIEDINDALKRWGDPDASRRGLNKKVYGGHGNGGKFYMRQMFKSSYFITYRDGNFSIFGFNENKKYGFDNRYKNLKINPEEALNIAELDNVPLPPHMIKNVLEGKTGFTVIKGINPKGIKNKIKIGLLINKLKNHPQSQNILSRINAGVIYNNEIIMEALKPEEIEPKKGFESPVIIDLPKSISVIENGEIINVEISNEKFPSGKLILKTSEIAFSSHGVLSNLNRIDIIGEIGVIGSYLLYEMGVKNFPQAAFIYGQCDCPILEDPENDMVKNDRTKLNDSATTRALLKWISDQADELAADIAKKESKERKNKQADVSSNLNKFLNTWKDKFMKKVISDILPGIDGKDKKLSSTIAKFHKKMLEAPEDLEFSYSQAKIPLGKEYGLTIKVLVPTPIPIGGVIATISNNDNIRVIDKKITIKNEDVKVTEDGQKVAVLNIKVMGEKVEEECDIQSSIGKYEAKIRVIVKDEDLLDTSKKNSNPKVLLSGIDPDPLGISANAMVILDPRQPLVYQRPQDAEHGIYWINTSSSIADAILEHAGPNSVRWRDFLLQRYVEIFVKEAIFKLQQTEPDSFSAERIDNDILGTVVTNTYNAAVEDLSDFLFNEEYQPEKNVSVKL